MKKEDEENKEWFLSENFKKKYYEIHKRWAGIICGEGGKWGHHMDQKRKTRFTSIAGGGSRGSLPLARSRENHPQPRLHEIFNFAKLGSWAGGEGVQGEESSFVGVCPGPYT